MTNAGGSTNILGYDSSEFDMNIVDGFCLQSDCNNYDSSFPGRGLDFSQGAPRVVGTPGTPLPCVLPPAGAVLMLTALGAFGVARSGKITK